MLVSSTLHTHLSAIKETSLHENLEKIKSLVISTKHDGGRDILHGSGYPTGSGLHRLCLKKPIKGCWLKYIVQFDYNLSATNPTFNNPRILGFAMAIIEVMMLKM